MYEAPYENHFLNIRAARPVFLTFARYTHAALLNTDNAALKALAAAFGAQLTELEKSTAERGGQDGTGQSQARSANDVTASIHEWVREAHDVHFKPQYRKQPAALLDLLPQGLKGITDASVAELPTRLQVLLDKIDGRAAELPAGVGTQGRALLRELLAARQQQAGTKKAVSDTIGDLGLDWREVCESLWQAHCTALAQFHAAPHHARAFFNYAALPNQNAKRAARRAAKSKVA
ncbi:hypothetical protein [Hymenobacter edaphi]|uniref:Uncharacterized protein n=1 Tax=Hymenobacter edaphi TaxID=2211146 RepID=A0A328BFM4_9BACT|nr:hypothetical protein [Hymenobacter edaphi]RAK64624.1 hypothetical protein DLM85_18220 [Hymenobacter edaphi]